MKAIMISIQPQWVEKILNGEKTIEIRKIMPKCELPCKVYIYCTKSKPTLQYFYNWQNYKPISEHSTWASGRTINVGDYGNGKVVAEFTLKQVEKINCCAVPYMKSNNLGYEHFIDDGVYQLKDKDGIVFERNDNSIETMLKNKDFEKMKLSPLDVYKYISGYGVFYAWHIDNLKIYDKPKELSEFVLPNKKNCKTCFLYRDMCNKVCEEIKQHLFRPPQSWCYVEELENE